MNLTKKILNFAAVLYIAVCLIQVLFLPINFLGFVDNPLFVFAFTFVVYHAYLDKTVRQLFIPFLILFLWTFISQFLRGDFDVFAHVNYQFIFLKFGTIVLVTFILLMDLKAPERVYRIIDWIFLILVAVNLFLVINPLGIGESVQHAYTSSSYKDFIYYHEPGSYRLAGTQLNPNDNAIVWACFILFYMLQIRAKWVFVLLALGILLLTQSRTTVLIITLIGLYYAVLFFLRNKNTNRIFYFGIPFFIGAFLIIVNSPYLKSLFNGSAFLSNSFLTRLDNYQYALSYNRTELIIGRGVINEPIERLGFSIDSEYLGLLLQFGIIGVVCWLFVLFTLLKSAGRQNTLLKLLVVMVILTSFTNFVFLNLQIGVVVSCFIGLSLAMRASNK